MKKNTNLHAAKASKNDEFYTRLSDIEDEVRHYKDFFNGKRVYCNCDDYRASNFFKYFVDNYTELGLSGLAATCYKKKSYDLLEPTESEPALCAEYDGVDVRVTELLGDGDFRSKECVELLKEADVVVGNPPFSLFREYVAQLMEYGKKFLIIGPQNAVTYKEIFPLIKNGSIWLGFNCVRWFKTKHQTAKSKITEDGTILTEGDRSRWFTNLDHDKRNIPIDLYKKYYSNECEFPKYDNYDAIEVSKTADIPMDYDGVMGVPITFLDKYCPDQFEIVDAREVALGAKQRGKSTMLIKDADSSVNGKPTYVRICIRRIK